MARKKNPNGSGTIRLRKDGKTWEARYSVKNPATGRVEQKSVYGKSQDEVAKKLRKVTADIDNGVYQEPSRITVGQWMDTWCAEFIGNVKEDTAKLYEQIIRTHIKPAFGGTKLQALQTVTIQRLYNKMIEDGKSAKTVKNVHGVMTASLGQAMALGYRPNNPASLCKLPRVQQAEMLPLDMPEASTFLDTIKGHRLRILYSVAMLTGMREGELLGMVWKNVDFERGTIRIDRQLLRPRRKGEVYRFGPPKNGKERTITPAPSVMAMLKEQKHTQNKQRLQAGPAWYSGEFAGLVFTDEAGVQIKYHTLLDNYKALLKQAGLVERRFHDLRHTYAVLSLISGTDPKSVSASLGHATVAFTLDRYSHFTETMQKRSAANMEALYQKL